MTEKPAPGPRSHPAHHPRASSIQPRDTPRSFKSKTPTRNFPYPVVHLLSAMTGVTLLAGALAGLPGVYKWIWRFQEIGGLEAEPRVQSLLLYIFLLAVG